MDDLTAQHLDRAAAIASAHAAVLGSDHHAAAARAGSAHRADALGLTVSRVHAPTGLFDRRYVPSLSVVLRGRKRSIVGDDDQVWGRERFIITPVDLPVVAGVVDTAGADGFVSAVWRLDPAIVGEVVSTMSAPTAPARGKLPRLGTWTAPLADAFARMLALLDAPEDVPCCSPSSPAKSSSACSRPNRHRASPPRWTAPAPPSSPPRPRF
ncbi:AraC family transcriptional regulator [Curtobacterium flaccumfaciens]|nr:AraC family transcriptional regulator [Curtobacterium flaccumfaciens]